MSVGAQGRGLLPYYNEGSARAWKENMLWYVSANSVEGRQLRAHTGPISWQWDDVTGRLTLLYSAAGKPCTMTPKYVGINKAIRKLAIDLGPDCPEDLKAVWNAVGKYTYPKNPSPIPCIESTEQGLVFEVPPLLRPFPQVPALQESEGQGTLQELAEPSALQPPGI